MNPLHHPLFVKFIVYFNKNQDYFECHEVLEEYWKSLPDGNKDHPLTAYILLSTGMYHWRRGNTVGALRTLQKAFAKMTPSIETYVDFTDGIDINRLRTHLKESINLVDGDSSFKPFTLPITSQAILSLIKESENEMTLLPYGSDAVIHKHMLRDRSDILRERDEKKEGQF